MSELKPGLYKATVRGRHDVTVFVDGAGYGRTAEYVGREWREHNPADITDARPLIVLDLGTGDAVDLAFYLKQIVETHPSALGTHGRRIFSAVADQVEAQTKPARIPEPGPWGVVEATYSGWHRGQWVHCDGVWRSLRDDGHEWVAWTSLVDPTLIREGVTNSE